MPDFSDWSFHLSVRMLADSTQLVATNKVTGQVVQGSVAFGPDDASNIDANLLVPGAGGCVEPCYKTVRHIVHTDIGTLGPEVETPEYAPEPT